MKIRTVAKLALTISLASSNILGANITATGSVHPVAVESAKFETANFGDKYYRTELYCGRSKPAGGMVSDEEWEKFLADEVTPRFPDGFTILNGTGRYREKSGKIVSEPSNVLVFLYENRKESRLKIEEIRAAYVKQFSQESVLRLDFKQRVEVSF